MKPIIFTLVGADKPGLIESLAKTVYQYGGNWLRSNFSHMAGHFAGFVEIDLPEEQHQALIDAFNAHPDLKITLMSAAGREAKFPNTAVINIMGNDKPGIVQEVTGVLNQFNINIRSFDSVCESAPNWGSELFKAQAVIAIPDDFDLDTLAERLEHIANDMVVDIDLQQ
ncbi:glycine cleavage system protein R [Aestuariibacter salexigens]|uniref:glycine cleavage system protein R n=1 Tax=Aestuariibacter salexigens TaxID=226010 RepID=UPI0004090084|nr:ACT domain-containing protein [Aestuariibacter salexigens]